MSVKDSIWVSCAVALKLKREGERKINLFNAGQSTAESMYLALCDLRELLFDIDYYQKFDALKDTKVKKITPFDTKMLPSVYTAEEKQEAERRKNMTEQELADEEVKAFLSGKIIHR